MPVTTTSVSAANRPDFQNTKYLDMGPYWRIIDDVRQGTLHMRQMGKVYLPKHPLESNKAYQNRLEATVFYNAYEHTLGGLVGMMFRQNPVLGEDVPVEIRGSDETKKDGYIENIDMQGTHFDVFVRELCADAFDGHSFLYVDMPPKVMQGNNPSGIVTLGDEKAAGIRPYWVKYRASDALNWRTKIVNGRSVLQQITFREQSMEADGEFGEVLVTRYRVLRPGSWTLFKETRKGNGMMEILPDADNPEGTTSLNEIPLAVIYGKKLGFLHSRPPLIDLAHLNIGHWQLMSDYRHILHYANVPVLWRSGFQPNNSVGTEGIGPNRIIDVGPNGQVAWAEHHGYAIGAARTELLDLEQRMSVLGLALLARKGDVEVTATEKILDSAEQSSGLSTIARSLQDGIELALQFTARYMGKPSGGSAEVNSDFQGLSIDPQKLTAYSNMVAQGQLSIETLWQMLEKYGELPEDFNPMTEMDRLQGVMENPQNLSASEMTDMLTSATRSGGEKPDEEARIEAAVKP